MRCELLIGCGDQRSKRLSMPGVDTEWSNLTTLDVSERCKPDVLWDLNNVPLPFDDNSFDEIHAYEVLEHTGTQGDWRFFFRQFQDFWRIMKPGALFIATCPMWDSPWAWSDPGHSRIISRHTLAFLSQSEYEAQVGKTPMTDYRDVYSGNFETIGVHEEEHNFGFVLKAIK